MQIELRHLRHFVAVAEELHFGRAAERLFMAQPPLSQSVRRLETELGVQLLDRTTRQVRLTGAGQVLLADAHGLIGAFESTVLRVRALGRGESGRLCIGFMSARAGPSLTPLLRSFADAHPEVDVQLKEFRLEDILDGIRRGEADLGFVRAPVQDDELRADVLSAEAAAAVVAADHRLALRRSVSINELNGEPLITAPAWSATANAAWTVDPRPNGEHPTLGPVAHTLAEGLELVAAGRGYVLVPASLAQLYHRDEVAFVRLSDAPSFELALVYTRRGLGPQASRFIEFASRHRPDQSDGDV